MNSDGGHNGQPPESVESPTSYDLGNARPQGSSRALRELRIGDQVQILGTFFRVQAVGPKGIRLKLVKRYGGRR